jgi:chemotaxis protein MotB
MGNRILTTVFILILISGGGYLAYQSRIAGRSLEEAKAALKVRGAALARGREETARQETALAALRESMAPRQATLAALRESIAPRKTALARLGRELEGEKKKHEATLERERKSAARHRADMESLRAALTGESSSAQKNREKLSKARAMLAKTEESRKTVQERAKLLSTKAQREEERARKLERDVAELSRKLASQQITLRRTKEMLQIDIVDRLLFDVGEARIKEKGLKTLDRISAFIQKHPGKPIQVEGHTDNQPISGALAGRYPTNWELSSARAIGVVRHLQSKGVSPRRLSATARSFYRPVAGNDSAEGRAKNRRIVILIGRRKTER